MSIATQYDVSNAKSGCYTDVNVLLATVPEAEKLKTMSDALLVLMNRTHNFTANLQLVR